MKNLKKENILNASEQIIVHQVNELGVMGAGLAKQIKEKYPKMFEAYKKYASPDKIGQCLLIRVEEDKYIANFFSQRGISRTHQTTDHKAFEKCLIQLSEYIKQNNMTVAFPYKIGCGLAGGNWDIVSKLIEKYIPNAVIYKL